MGLKQRIENNLIIYTIIIFFSGITSAWFIMDKLWIGPKDIIIEQLRMGIVNGGKTAKYEMDNTDKEDVKISKALDPVSLSVIFDLDEINTKQAIDSIRGENRLRELSYLESGKTISEVPTGTYFYFAGSFLEIDDGDLTKLLNTQDVDRYKESGRRDFEIHNEGNSISVVGFLSATDAAEVSMLNGIDKKKITLFPLTYGEANNMTLIPFNRIYKSESRSITLEPGKNASILDLIIR
jgi:hypothetical protein